MNRNALGFFKDELNSGPLQQFVGLRPKCYAFLRTGKVNNNVFQHTNPVEKKTATGVKRWTKDTRLQFCTLLGHTQQLSYISLSTERDQVYTAHCAHRFTCARSA